MVLIALNMLQFVMKYIDWHREHSLKHKAIIEHIKDKSKDEIIEYFYYDNMRQKHPNFCQLYAQNSKCHDMKNLNCYMCGCPYFRFKDDGIEIKGNRVVYSYCTQNLGDEFISDNAIHHDCSECTLPHSKKFISDNFDLDWNVIMGDVVLEK